MRNDTSAATGGLTASTIETGIDGTVPTSRRRKGRSAFFMAATLAVILLGQTAGMASATETAGATAIASGVSATVQSFVILLREGAEAVLIFAALWLALRGMKASPRAFAALSWGGFAGIVASVITAAAISLWLMEVDEIAELVEGGALLLAALVLLFVSSWLLGRREAAAWKARMQQQAQAALAGSSLFGLFAVGFLVIFREGAETVLFYQALLAGENTGPGPLVAGALAALAVLAAAFALVRRLGMTLPLRTFFTITAWALLALAVVYAGKGTHALQEFGLIDETPLPFVPRLPFLGVYPYAETLVAQALALIAGLLLNRRATSMPAHQPAE